MMTYTFAFAAFANGRVESTSLTQEINYQERLGTLLVSLDHIDTFTATCDITFTGVLSAPEVTVLNGIVAAHRENSTPSTTIPASAQNIYSGELVLNTNEEIVVGVNSPQFQGQFAVGELVVL